MGTNRVQFKVWFQEIPTLPQGRSFEIPGGRGRVFKTNIFIKRKYGGKLKYP